ncbi:MAG: septum site-determining protein Ssd [Actinomycetes bacterium]
MSPSSGPPPSSVGSPADVARPLVVTGDQELLDDVLRLSAAAGVEVDVVTEAALARPSWPHSPLVVVGDDAAALLARSGLARRAGVVLVGTDLDDGSIWRRAVQVGAEHVVFLPDSEGWLVERFADTTGYVPRSCSVLATVGARGGAGATTLAAALAGTGVRRGLRTLLVDADPLGGGIDLVLGGEDATGLRWPDLADTVGRLGGAALHGALPRVGELAVLSWDRGDLLDVPPEAVAAVLGAATRSADLVVVDLPRRFDEGAAEALVRAAATLLLVPAEVRATAAATRVATGLAPYAADVRLVVRGPAPSGLTGADIADAVGLPLFGEMKAEPGIIGTLERGEPPARRGRSPLARLCGHALDVLVPAASASRGGGGSGAGDRPTGHEVAGGTPGGRRTRGVAA